MKKKLVMGLVLASSMASMPMNVLAKGSATINFTSNSEVSVGEEVKVIMSVEDILDTEAGVVSFGGKLTYDEEKLEYVSAKNLDTPYAFQINPKTMMLAGLDYTLANGIYNNMNIYEFTFKAKEAGTTEITLNKPVVTEIKDYLTPTVNAKVIEIVEKKEEKVVETKKEEQKEVKKEVQEAKKVETNKAKLEKMSGFVHNILKKLTNFSK